MASRAARRDGAGFGAGRGENHGSRGERRPGRRATGVGRAQRPGVEAAPARRQADEAGRDPRPQARRTLQAHDARAGHGPCKDCRCCPGRGSRAAPRSRRRRPGSRLPGADVPGDGHEPRRARRRPAPGDRVDTASRHHDLDAQRPRRRLKRRRRKLVGPVGLRRPRLSLRRRPRVYAASSSTSSSTGLTSASMGRGAGLISEPATNTPTTRTPVST